MLYTCGRPITGQRYCVLGRETALQEVEWTKDGWPKLKGEGNLPSKTVEVEADGIQKRGRKVYYGFQDGKMPFEFRTLRVALEPGVGSGARKRLHRADTFEKIVSHVYDFKDCIEAIKYSLNCKEDVIKSVIKF